MVLSDEGAQTYLADARGATYPLVVDEVVSKQLFKAHTAELLQAGDYKLVVKSRAGDAEGPLQTAFRRVKYLATPAPVPPVPVGPVIERVSMGEGVEDDLIDFGTDSVTVYGSGFEGFDPERDSVTLALYAGPDRSEPMAVLDQLENPTANEDGTQLQFANRANTSEYPDGMWWGQETLLTITIDGKTATHRLTFRDNS